MREPITFMDLEEDELAQYDQVADRLDADGKRALAELADMLTRAGYDMGRGMR